MVQHLEPQSTMAIPVLDDMVSMNLPPCWMGKARGLEHYGKVVFS